MLVAKFVDDNYMRNNISFSNFGTPVNKDMFVVPINEDVSFNFVPFHTKAVLLHVSEENIISCKENKEFKVKCATPVRDLNDEELSILRLSSYQKPHYAYKYALYVDKKPTNKTRSVSCKSPHFAYCYALYVDKKPTNETRTASCMDPYYAYCYARDVDKKPTNETRFAACQSQCYALYYAKDIDKISS